MQNLTDYPELKTAKGNHGWDNANMNMRPIFLAYGPDFKSGYVGKPFNNVDIYPLMCELLGIDGAPNNGSLDNTQDLLHRACRKPVRYCKKSTKCTRWQNKCRVEMP